jgi:hypothetical protein
VPDTEPTELPEVADERGFMGTRAGHVAWAKERALEYADAGDLPGAMASLTSDLSKHPETCGHAAIELMMLEAMSGFLNSPAEVRKFIDGVR